MKQANVPYLSELLSNEENAIPSILKSKGVEIHIDELNWEDQFPAHIPTSAFIAHDGNNLYVLYSVTGEVLRVVNEKDFMPVWEDSCVEFFMQRDGEKLYRNFECNTHGVLLASQRKTREDSERLPLHQIQAIKRTSFIKHRYMDDKEVSDWMLLLVIPKISLGFGKDKELSHNSIRANFYKCGDETASVHYQSWNRIDTPSPNFHQPQFFGKLIFE